MKKDTWRKLGMDLAKLPKNEESIWQLYQFKKRARDLKRKPSRSKGRK